MAITTFSSSGKWAEGSNLNPKRHRCCCDRSKNTLPVAQKAMSVSPGCGSPAIALPRGLSARTICSLILLLTGCLDALGSAVRRCRGCCSAVPWHGAGGPSRLPNYRWIAAGVHRTRPLSLLAPRTEPQINICNQPWLRQEIIAFALQMNWKMSNNGIC